MDLKELYHNIDGDYDDAFRRFQSEERMIKFLKMGSKDDNYGKLVKGLEDKDYEKAFMAIHTIKGIVANFSFNAIYKSSSDLCEVLRDKKYNDNIKDAFNKFDHDYHVLTSNVRTFLSEVGDE